jgi:hypothetical protein
MEFIMAGTAGQAKAANKSAQAAIALGKPETLAGVPRVQKGEIHQMNLREGRQFEEGEGLAMQA